jgi:hypothetical protein
MVHVEFWRPGREIGRSECVATLTQHGREVPKIDGRDPQVVDLDHMMLSLSTGRAIRWDDDLEEWARSLASSYRSGYLLVEIARDDHSIHEPVGKRLTVRRPARS